MTPKERSTDLINKFGGSAEKVVNEIIALQVWTNPNTTENLAYWKEVLAAVKVNKAPIARAGLDQKIFLPINTAKLDGSASSDPDGSIIDLQYFWRKVIGPSLILIDATKAIATANNLVAGEYLFELKVVDKFNAFTFDFVTIRVIGTTTVNQSPTANAGLNASITLPVNTVTLSGSGSDPDGSIVGYQWTKISGPAQFAISSPNTAQTLVSNLVVGTYTFQLRVTDNKGATATDTVVITVNDVVVIPPGENFFASPTGTGTGTQASPFKIGDFFKLAKPGMTLNLMDGKYTGATSMITPPSGISGISGKPITIRAINDGKVDIDGELQRQPVLLDNNNWFVLEGFNAHSAGPKGSSASVVSIKYSNNNIVRRVVGWDATDGNSNVFGVHNSSNNLLEDCAGFGIARKTFSNSQNGNFTTLRRCFARWEGNHTDGPKYCYTFAYESTDALYENVIATWDSIMLKEDYQVTNYEEIPYTGTTYHRNGRTAYRGGSLFSDDGQTYPTKARVLGSIGFVAKDQHFHNELGQFGVQRNWSGALNTFSEGTVVRDTILALEGTANQVYYPMYLQDGNVANSSVTKSTIIGGIQNNMVPGSWNVSGNNQSSNAAALIANGGNILDPAKNGITNAANLMKRYVNGAITNENLWPWPMNQRIIDAMTHANRKPMDVTRKVFELFGGTMPAFGGGGNIDTITAKAKQWLSSPADRGTLEGDLSAWSTGIDDVMAKVKPVHTKTQTGEIFFQNIPKYPEHQYHMFVPAHYKPTIPMGLMLWLNGGGSYEVDGIQRLADYEMDDEKVTSRSGARTETDTSNYILVAPIALFGSFIPHPQHASRWDVPGADQYLMDVITEVATHYNVDYNRIVIAGFSMGGIGAYHVAQRLNDRVAAVMASAGSWDIGDWKALSSPLYIIHGVTDAYFNSGGCRNHNTAIEYARLAKQAMGANCELKEYPGGHGWDNIGQAAWTNFINGQAGWVTTKVRDPYRKNLTALNPWRSYDVGSNFGVTWTERESPHTMWLTIKEIGTGTIGYDQAKKSGDGSCSSLTSWSNWSLTLATLNLKAGKASAVITGNQIAITATNVKRLSVWLHPKMVDITQPVLISVNGGAATSHVVKPSLLKALQSYERRRDWAMIYHGEIEIVIP